MKNRVQAERVRALNSLPLKRGPVVYWMSRDQRIHDNWALLFSQDLAAREGVPLLIVFCLVTEFQHAAIRQYGFLLRGLQELEKALRAKNIPFFLLTGKPEVELPLFLSMHKAGAVVSDFDPLRIKREWKESVSAKISVAHYEVDAHNIVPCWRASPKREYGAYTLRPKIQKVLPRFLVAFPKVRKSPPSYASDTIIDWPAVWGSLKVDREVREVTWLRPGEKSAQRLLHSFVLNKLPHYDEKRNNPVFDGQSHLSSYLHFGQLSAQRVALEVIKSSVPHASRSAFLEELIVRRELADNFCFYTQAYDQLESFPDWAIKTLQAHRRDRREHVYAVSEFEQAATHDPLWNAAQRQMVQSGSMHGFMRMYWAKKILEWTESPEQALEIALYLNDRYELDGRDPNGYAGIAWCIGGVHDRAWNERRIFGKIRYMSYKGCKAKFRVDEYIQQVNAIPD